MNKFIFYLTCAILVTVAAGCGKQEAEKPKIPMGIVCVSTIPAGADVECLGKKLGKTPFTTKAIPVSTYIFKISKSGYYPAWVCVKNENGKTVNAEALLRPEMGTLLVTSEPAGAKVFREQEEIGITPCILSNLTMGPLTLHVEKAGFATQEVACEIRNDRPVHKDVKLMSIMGTLNITSEPDGAQVFLNQVDHGVTPLKETVEHGTYEIRVVKNGYYDFVCKQNVESRADIALKAEMKIKPMTIAVNSDPVSGEVLINDERIGVTPCEFSTSETGEYKVLVKKDNFASEEQTVKLIPGSHEKVDVKLEYLLGSISLVTCPGVVEVYVDNKFIGVTSPDPENPNISKIFTVPDLTAGLHEVKVQHKRAQPKTKRTIVMNVLVEKRKTTRIGKNLELWVPNYILHLKNNMRSEGRILDPKSDPVRFEPRPGISYDYPKSEIQSLIPIEDYKK